MHLSAHLLFHPFIHLHSSFHLSIYPSTYSPNKTLICPSIHPLTCLSIHPCTHPFNIPRLPFIHPLIHPSIYLLIHLPFYPPTCPPPTLIISFSHALSNTLVEYKTHGALCFSLVSCACLASASSHPFLNDYHMVRNRDMETMTPHRSFRIRLRRGISSCKVQLKKNY